MSVLGTDLCAVMWGGGNPPPPLPPGSGSGGGPLYNVAGGSGGIALGNVFNGKTSGGAPVYFAVGEILNDNSSKLIGFLPMEIDVSLKKVGNPIGYVSVFVFQTKSDPYSKGGPNDNNVIGGAYNVIDVSTLTTGFVNYKFSMAIGPIDNSYKLQVGDRIVAMWTGGGLTTSNDYVLIDNNKNNPFDGNHSVAVAFAATANTQPYHGLLGAFAGSWIVLTGQDIAGTWYV